MAQAIQIEMQLLSQKQFEDELKMIFFQTGHADIWENITKRVQEGEQAQREAARRARDAAILALLYGAGLRRETVAKLTLANLDLDLFVVDHFVFRVDNFLILFGSAGIGRSSLTRSRRSASVPALVESVIGASRPVFFQVPRTSRPPWKIIASPLPSSLVSGTGLPAGSREPASPICTLRARTVLGRNWSAAPAYESTLR